MIIDRISTYLGRIDTHRNSEVRSVLAPLSKLAQQTSAAFCLVSHLNKGSGSSAAYRLSRSIAFTAAVHASLMVVKDRNDPQRRLVLPGKTNVGADNIGGIAYRVQQNASGKPYLEFESGPVMISADEALDTLDDEQSYARDEAADFLNDFLLNGPVPAKDVVRAAGAAGISKRTLDQAKAAMCVHSGKREFSGGTWYWSLRPRNHAKVATSTNSPNGGNLRMSPASKVATNTEDCHGLDGRGVGNVGKDGKWHTIL